MIVLDRATILAALQAYLAGQQTAESLAAWAFDQFYAAEEDRLSYESGYRRVLAQVLDELMFSDDPHFQLERAQVEHMMTQIESAPLDLTDEDDEDEDDEDEE